MPTPIGADDATLRWDQVAGAAKYRVYWSTSASMPSRCEPTCAVLAPDDLGSPSVTLSDALAEAGDTVVPGQQYFIKVSAVNGSGKTITGYSSSISVDLVGGPPVIPAAVEGIAAEDITETMRRSPGIRRTPP